MYRTPKLYVYATMPVGILADFLGAVGMSSDADVIGGIDYPTPDVAISVKEAANASNDSNFVKEILDELETMLSAYAETDEMVSAHVQCMSKRICDLLDAEASSRDIGPTRSYHSDTSNQNRKEISDLWTGGELRAIFTTYDCGID